MKIPVGIGPSIDMILAGENTLIAAAVATNSDWICKLRGSLPNAGPIQVLSIEGIAPI